MSDCVINGCGDLDTHGCLFKLSFADSELGWSDLDPVELQQSITNRGVAACLHVVDQVADGSSEIRIEDIETDELYDFDEIFMTSTTRDVSTVVAVEGKKIGTGRPGPLTRKIQEAFKAMDW